MENLHQGHRERLKQQFLTNGLEQFQPHQILELLLFYTRPRIDTNEIAHSLINTFGSLSGVFDAPFEELIKIKGLSDNGAILLKLLPKLLGAYSVNSVENETMNNVKTVCNYFYGCYIGVENEQLRVCCLDDNLHIVACPVIASGTMNAVPINTRKIVEATYRSNCGMIILAHNHPNGEASPSKEDVNITRRLVTVLESVGIKLLDHIIVGPKHAISMRDCGYFSIYD